MYAAEELELHLLLSSHIKGSEAGAMTSLRTFQTEIDEISHREVAKQRALAAVERAKLEKDAKKPPVPKTHTHARKDSTPAAEAAVEPTTPKKEPIGPAGEGGMSDIDEQLQVRCPDACVPKSPFI